MVDSVAISASILALLSFISAVLGICMFLVFWKYRANEGKKTKWATSPSELRPGWLSSERKPLVPGTFTAKTIQPSQTEAQEGRDEEDDEWKENGQRDDDQDETQSCGEILFILRYLVERDELMVRLVQMEGFSAGEDIYNADSAYVDVQLKHIGMATERSSNSPPRLDIALQQVYYFIISQDQLFSYKLFFKVNTFDQSFRRSVSGEVEVNLFEELGKNIFTGNEVILSRQILPVSLHSSYDKDLSLEPCSEADKETRQELKFPEGVTSPSASPLCWDSECDMASSKSSGLVPYADLSDGVQWHRLSGDSWEEKAQFQWPYLSDSVVSVPSSFQFNPSNETGNNLQNRLPDNLRIEEPKDSILVRRSVSESYIPHYGRLSPPPKNFYHLMPIPLSSKPINISPFTRRQRHTAGNRLKGREPFFTFDNHEGLSRKRSLSLPSLFGNSSTTKTGNYGENKNNQGYFEVRNRKTQSPGQTVFS